MKVNKNNTEKLLTFKYSHADGRTINVKAKSEKDSREVLSFLIDEVSEWNLKETELRE